MFSIFEIGTSHTASSEDNDLDREAAGDSGFSDGKYLINTLTITTSLNVIIIMHTMKGVYITSIFIQAWLHLQLQIVMTWVRIAREPFRLTKISIQVQIPLFQRLRMRVGIVMDVQQTIKVALEIQYLSMHNFSIE